MGALIDRREFAGLSDCTYLNQASLGLIPRVAVEASTRFLTDVAQHGNLRLSDQAEGGLVQVPAVGKTGILSTVDQRSHVVLSMPSRLALPRALTVEDVLDTWRSHRAWATVMTCLACKRRPESGAALHRSKINMPGRHL